LVSDWSSDVCSSDLEGSARARARGVTRRGARVEDLVLQDRVAGNRIFADSRAQQGGKVALDLGLRGNRLELAISQVLDHAPGRFDFGALIIAEHEQLVLDDRSTGGDAELVLL